MLKILQARLQQYVNHELPDVQAGFSKGRETRDQIANICWNMKKQGSSRKHLFLFFLTSELSGKESSCQGRRQRFESWLWEIPWRRNWQHTPVFLPGKSHGQRSLAGYSPWGCKRVGFNLETKQEQTMN